MSLLTQNVAIVPTPSGIIDGHFPNGDDGTAGIPLTWAAVPNFLQKQVGTPFTVDLFTLYLTQPGGATASVSVGALSGGWSLSSPGVLSYSGSGQGTGTIRVRATRAGATSDSNLFTFESIDTIVSSDTNPPTIPTGVALISKTTTTITLKPDVPADVPTSLIPSSGFKEVRWFKDGVVDGVSGYGAGLLQRLTKLDMATGGGGRRLPLGHFVAPSTGQVESAGGIPNANHGPNYVPGPCGPGITAVVIRYRWWEVETTQGNYNFTRLDNEIAQAAALNVMFYAMIEVRTFDYSLGRRNPMPDYLVPYSMTFGSAVISNSIAGTLTNGSKVITGFSGSQTSTVVVKGAISCASGKIPPSAVVTAVSATTITMDLAATGSGTENITWSTQPSGYQGFRWDPFVSGRFQALVNAIGARYDSVSSATYDPTGAFAGIATQETANGTATLGGFTQTGYADALIAESRFISAACPRGRHLCYFNFMGGNQATGDAQIDRYTHTILSDGNGAILGGPDLAPDAVSSVVNRCYSNYTDYHNGIGLNGAQVGAGFTFCSVQPSEWSGGSSGPPASQRLMGDLYNYGTSTYTYQGTVQGHTYSNFLPVAQGGIGSPLNLDIIVWNWQQTPNWAGEESDPTITGATGIAVLHPTFGTVPVPSSMPAGTVTQSATGIDYTVTSSGTGINAADDQWTCASNSVNADVTVICKLTGMSGADLSQATAGICIRQSTAVSTPAVYLVATTTTLRSRYRISASAAVTNVVDTASQGWNVPKFLKITRVGDLFSFYYSTTGLAWTAVGTATVPMTPNVVVQLFPGKGSGGTTAVTATFQQVNIQQLTAANYTFVGLTTATSYSLTAVGRDLANNDSAASPALVVVTN